MMTKLDNTINKLNDWLIKFKSPVVMSSFGKDSMVMLFIIFRLMEQKLPVIYHGAPWAPWRNDFAWGIMKAYNLEVYDYPPVKSGIKVKPDRLELVHRYQISNDKGIDIPVNVLPPEGTVKYACGLKMLERPKGIMEFPWDLILIGHKNCDVDQFEGPVPLKTDLVEQDGVPALGFPLRDWSDEELWEFIESRRVPVQYGTRYVERKEIDFKVFNNDYIEACTACIDPRQPKKVFCPLVEHEIDNVSAMIPRMEDKPSYIGG
jgi:hypothetical protein